MINKIEQMKNRMKLNALDGAKSSMKKDLLGDILLNQLDTNSLRELHNFWMKQTHLAADKLKELELLESNLKSIRITFNQRGQTVGQPVNRFPN